MVERGGDSSYFSRRRAGVPSIGLHIFGTRPPTKTPAGAAPRAWRRRRRALLPVAVGRVRRDAGLRLVVLARVEPARRHERRRLRDRAGRGRHREVLVVGPVQEPRRGPRLVPLEEAVLVVLPLAGLEPAVGVG